MIIQYFYLMLCTYHVESTILCIFMLIRCNVFFTSIIHDIIFERIIELQIRWNFVKFWLMKFQHCLTIMIVRAWRQEIVQKALIAISWKHPWVKHAYFSLKQVSVHVSAYTCSLFFRELNKQLSNTVDTIILQLRIQKWEVAINLRP